MKKCDIVNPVVDFRYRSSDASQEKKNIFKSFYTRRMIVHLEIGPKKHQSKIHYWVNPLLLIVFFAFPLCVFAATPEKGTVIHIYDGDTISVRIGTHIERVRLLGIDAPERVSKEKREQCYWNEARKALRDSVLKREIVLTRDEHERNRDIYGRLLRYITLKEKGNIIINEQMVRDGFSYTYNRSSSPIKERYKALEKNAQSQKRGLWSKKTCRGRR